MNEQYGLTVENLLNVLPDVLRQDEKMLALATGVAEILTARPAEIEQNMLYQHIDTLPEDLLWKPGRYRSALLRSSALLR